MLLAQMNIDKIDLVIIIAYLVGIAAVGIMASHKRKTTSSEFFLAGKTLPWPMVGAALFAANISTIHLVGLASAGYDVGLVMGNFEWMASFCLVILGLVFAPFYFRSRIRTLPEYLEKRYSPGSRTVMACVAIVAALLIHIGVSLYAGALLFEHFFNISVYVSIAVISIVTAIYVIIGGLKAVVVTETIQTIVLLFGAAAITVAAIFALGDKGLSLANLDEGIKDHQMNMVHSVLNEKPVLTADGETVKSTAWLADRFGGPLNEFSWLAVLLGYPVLGIWYWCSDQTIVQKVLGAKSEADAQAGPLFAGFLKILPVFLMVFPGVLAYVLFKDEIATPDDTLPVLIDKLIGPGWKGLITAGMLAALMSTIAAALNSIATVVSVDIVQRLRPSITEQQQVFTGRITAVVVMLLAMGWSTVVGNYYSSIFVAINKIPMIFAPAITCVFLFGIFWRRGTWQASLTTLIVGCIVGFIYFLLDLPAFHLMDKTQLIIDSAGHQTIQTVLNPQTGEPVWAMLFTDVVGIPFMIFGPLIFVFCSVLYVIVSLMTPKHSDAALENVCWQHPLATIVHSKIVGIADARVLAGILLTVMVVLYSIFH